jgi:hypothetical protein
MTKITQFKRDAAIAKRDINSIGELKLWIKADNLIPEAVKEVDKIYISLKELKHKMTKIFHSLEGTDAVDSSATMGQLDKALENLETLLSRYA